MNELKGKLHVLKLDYSTGKAILSFEIEDKQSAMRCWDGYDKNERLSIKVDKYREKRSLNANNYAWALITEIANAVRLSKEAVYKTMLRDYGQSSMISVKADIPIEQYIKYCDEAGQSTLNGTLFKHYKVYKGSSEFTTDEMAVFIDGIVHEAQQLEIDTRTPDEIARLKSLWG
jgi:hypothetical protein